MLSASFDRHWAPKVAALAASLILLSSGVQAQGIRGTVRDAGSRLPVAAAAVQILSARGVVLATSVTGADGSFLVHWNTPGSVRIRVRRLGYSELLSQRFELTKPDTVPSTLLIAVDAIPLEPVVVRGLNLDYDITGDMAAVERRMKLGNGRWIRRETIEASRATDISELLEQIPGIILQTDASLSHVINAYATLNLASYSSPGRGRSGSGGACPLQVFLDGKAIKFNPFGVNLIHAQEVEVIEVFRGLSEVPAELSSDLARCGVLAIWSRKY